MDCKEESLDYEELHKVLLRLSGKERWFYWLVKRIFDIIFSIVMLLMFSPLFLLICILIYLDDPHGSPIYSQIRVGRKGVPFRLYKFRTMVTGAASLKDSLIDVNEKDGPVFKIKNDLRITKIGRILRKTSIDEFPQFWNVLKGDMTVVGPRPALPEEVECYTPYQRDRLLVTPGLTCYWQTAKNRDSISFYDWMDMDIRYIKERNFRTDIKLILLTIKVVLTGEGQ